MGIKPQECVAFVIVPDKNAKHESGAQISLSKNVSQDLESFIDGFTGDEEYAEECVYVFSHGSDHNNSSDVENTVPKAFFCTEYSETGILDRDDYDKHGYLMVELVDEEDEDSEREDCPLLYCINGHIEGVKDSWLKIPRHHQPAPQFAVPPVPTVEQRILKQSPLPKEDLALQLETVTRVWSFDRRRLLLLRRR